MATGDLAKADRAEALLASGVTIGVQVLNETANVLRRKGGFSWEETPASLATARSLVTVEPMTIETHAHGLRIADHYRLIDDAMIVAAARLADCDLLWSEDMQDGLRIDDALQIRNPFVSDSGGGITRA